MTPKITPLEIRKHEFSRRMKGFDAEEVNAYLAALADDLEEMLREYALLEARVERLEQENAEHRERELILKETLLTAQRASEDVKAAARREAEMIVRQGEVTAQRITEQALARSADIEKAIGDLKLQRANFRLKLQTMIELFQQVLEFDKEADDTQGSVSYLTRKKDETAG